MPVTPSKAFTDSAMHKAAPYDTASFAKRFFEKRRRGRWLLLVLALCLVGSTLVFTGGGFMPIPPLSVGSILLGQPVQEAIWRDVVWDIRLPRVLKGLVVGGILGCSGAIFQAVLLNPLASPSTLGVSSGAAFGGALAFYLGFANPIPLAFAGGLTTLLLVLALGASRKTLHPTDLILAGVIVSAMFSAGVSFLKYLFREEVGSLIFWIMGSLVASSWADVRAIVPFAIALLVVSVWAGDTLNVITLGDSTAKQLGAPVQLVRIVLLTITSLAVAAAVATSGVIAFVGLVIPHLVRILIGPDHRYLLPASALAGALLLLAADNVIRIWVMVEVPVGVITTLLGGPFFCYLFLTRGHSWKTP